MQRLDRIGYFGIAGWGYSRKNPCDPNSVNLCGGESTQKLYRTNRNQLPCHVFQFLLNGIAGSFRFVDLRAEVQEVPEVQEVANASEKAVN